MDRSSFRGVALTTLTMLGLSASALLTGCFEKDSEKPTGGTCDTAVTVVKRNGILVLQKADSTYLVPTGADWTNFNAKANDKLLVGYSTKKSCGSQTTVRDSTAGGSAAGGSTVRDSTAQLGCIRMNPGSK